MNPSHKPPATKYPQQAALENVPYPSVLNMEVLPPELLPIESKPNERAPRVTTPPRPVPHPPRPPSNNARATQPPLPGDPFANPLQRANTEPTNQNFAPVPNTGYPQNLQRGYTQPPPNQYAPYQTPGYGQPNMQFPQNPASYNQFPPYGNMGYTGNSNLPLAPGINQIPNPGYAPDVSLYDLEKTSGRMNEYQKLVAFESDMIFDKYDLNRSGYLDVKEIYPAIASQFTSAGKEPPSIGMVLKVMEKFDSDHNGLLDRNEFKNLMFKLYNAG